MKDKVKDKVRQRDLYINDTLGVKIISWSLLQSKNVEDGVVNTFKYVVNK